MFLGTWPTQGPQNRGRGLLQSLTAQLPPEEQVQLFTRGVAAGWLRKAACSPSSIDAPIGGSRHGTVAQGGCTAPGQLGGASGLWNQWALQSVLQDAFPLALGPTQGGFIPTGQGQVWLVVVGCILAGVQPQAPFGAPGLQSAGSSLTLPQGWPVGQEVIAIHIFGVGEEPLTLGSPAEWTLETPPCPAVVLAFSGWDGQTSLLL